MAETSHPFSGQIVLLAGAKASVTLERLSELLERAHEHVCTQRAIYDRQFERIDDGDGLVYYLVDAGHWDEVGEQLGFSARESDAIRRAHTAQFRRAGRQLGRLDEFETALDIREVVVVNAPVELSR